MIKRPVPLFSKQSTVNYDSGYKNVLFMDEFELIQFTGTQKYDDQAVQGTTMLFLTFQSCKQEFMVNGSYCADQAVIDSYMKTFTRIVDLNIVVQQFDPINDVLNSIFKTSYVVLNSHLRFYSQILLQQTIQAKNNGWILDNIEQSRFISEVEIISQIVSEDFPKAFFGHDCLATFFFRMNDLVNEQYISYPKLGEVMAQVGSLVSLLMTLRIVVEQANSFILENETINLLLHLFYPKLSQLEITQGPLYDIRQVKRNGVDINSVAFKQLYGQARQEVSNKLSFLYIQSTIKNLQDKLQELERSKKPSTLDPHGVVGPTGQNGSKLSRLKIYPSGFSGLEDLHSGKNSLNNDDEDEELNSYFRQVYIQT